MLWLYSGICLQLELEKKTIVALTNSTVFILDFYITKPVWSHVLPLSAKTLNI